MVDELRDVTKALLGYGARLPKELMLFVKDILFLNGAMASMAPDVDILGEILAVVTYFTERHGEQIARDVGVDLVESPIDLDGYRAALGFADETDPITFQDLQERRELIRRRLEQRNEQPDAAVVPPGPVPGGSVPTGTECGTARGWPAVSRRRGPGATTRRTRRPHRGPPRPAAF